MTKLQEFIIRYGWQAFGYELAAATGYPFDEVQRVRSLRASRKLPKLKRFAELFTLWHGRPPRDDEWPMPQKSGGGYDWQGPEITLLASLVGRMGKPEISRILTKRLRQRTGDRSAVRDVLAVQNTISRIGMQTTDIVGGITLSEAGKEVAGYYTVWNAVKRGDLASFRIGRVLCIPHKAWAEWKAKIVFPPKGYITLASLRVPLGFNSDAKLPHYAERGWIPTAVRCNVWGRHGSHTSRFGTWFIDPKVGRRLLADRRAGKAMPWFGKGDEGNLKVTWRLLEERRHPATCETCRKIWGPKGAPRTYEDYAVRYVPLDHGAKRHLTRPYSHGLTLEQVAKECNRSWAGVRLAINNGTLRATKVGRTHYVNRTDATRWKARKCPVGRNEKSWISLGGAKNQYGFKVKDLRAYMADGTLRSMVGTFGAMRGITYVLKQQVRELREKIGYSETDAAARICVSVHRLRKLLAGVNWRGAEGIPPETLRACQRRCQSQDGGRTIEQAARELRRSPRWIKDRILDGTVRIARAKFDRRRLYLTAPMLERLRKWKPTRKVDRFSSRWLPSTPAAREAGVSVGQLTNWRDDGLPFRMNSDGHHFYAVRSLRAWARRYWEHPRLHRATPPQWLQHERATIAARSTNSGRSSLTTARPQRHRLPATLVPGGFQKPMERIHP